MKSVTPKKKPPVKARKSTSNEIIWLECEHFCHDEHSHVLLRWDRPSGPVYRTGYWHDAKLKYVGSGDVEFRTQPHYLSVLEPTTPIFVLPATDKAYRTMHRQIMEAIIDNESDDAAIILAAIGITKPANDAGREEGKP